MTAEARLVYMTAGSLDEAKSLGAMLVDERLAACANIIPGMISVYRWQGEVRNDEEVVLIAKTRADLAEPLVARVREVHSYDCPCVLVLPVETGNPAFLAWIAEETADAPPQTA